MAEILLSLTIIGVVAAITLPSLTGNINERTWNTQRKALYSRMSQAISLMPAINGYGKLREASSEGASDAVDTAAETFLTAGLSKVLKINNICSENLVDCGIVTSYTNMVGSKLPMPTTLYSLNNAFSNAAATITAGGNVSYSTLNTKAAAFETQNGESIVIYYNPSCKTEYLTETTRVVSGSVSDMYGFPQRNMCINFIYDLNGTKGPNTVGKDIGIMTVFNATDCVVVAPMPSSSAPPTTNRVNYAQASKECLNHDAESRVPNIEELSSLYINKDLVNLIDYGNAYWSSTRLSSNGGWTMDLANGIRRSCGLVGTRYVRCVKR